jgi:hypothetical protein
MNKDEKTGFWFFTMLIKNGIDAYVMYLNDKQTKQQISMYSKLVIDYLKSGEKIPFQVLNLIKQNTTLDYFRKYMRQIGDGFIEHKNDKPKRVEHDLATIKVLLEDINKEAENISIEDVDMQEESTKNKELLIEFLGWNDGFNDGWRDSTCKPCSH